MSTGSPQASRKVVTPYTIRVPVPVHIPTLISRYQRRPHIAVWLVGALEMGLFLATRTLSGCRVRLFGPKISQRQSNVVVGKAEESLC